MDKAAADATGVEMRDIDDDHTALSAASCSGVGLCTIVGIEGSFSRRLGAQLAVLPTGEVTGSLADGCLEKQLAADVAQCGGPTVRRYGRGSSVIDFRLPCGGGLDILLDPQPDREACRRAMAKLDAREPASLQLASNELLGTREYIPRLRLRAFGEGPELDALEELSLASRVFFERYDSGKLSLGREPDLPPADPWTAVILLFHDHEWEAAILRHALAGPSFYIGAQGGAKARQERIERLSGEGASDEQLTRIRGPVGIIPSSRTPRALALSILSEIVGEYERLHPHA